MTDKEMAEEYARENYEPCIYVGSNGWQTDYKVRLQAFLAGLEAGKPKWYRLRGDIQILPAVYETVLDENGDKIVYAGRDIWKAYSEHNERFVEVDPPVAWCELPKYIEEKSNIAQEIINKPTTLDIKSDGFGEIEPVLLGDKKTFTW